MVPPHSDPKWTFFLDHLKDLPVTGLATRMFMSRLNIQLIFDDSPAFRKDAIERAHSFFSKNQSMIQDDIQLIFGSRRSL